MKLYLNAGNGGLPMGEPAIRFIKDNLFDGVRVGIPNGIPTELLGPIVQELAAVNLEACFIVGGWDWWGGASAVSKRDLEPPPDLVAKDAVAIVLAAQRTGMRFYIEVGNEPNLSPPRYKKDPAGFASHVNLIAAALDLAGALDDVSVIAGGASNVNPWDGLPYLAGLESTLAPLVILGVHPYRMGSRPWDDLGDRSMASIGLEVASLRPRFAITEGGWHTAPRRAKRDFPLCFSYREVPGWTDEEMVFFATHELDFWAGLGAEFYVWYQINDGPTNTQEDRFGIRTLKGDPKPVAGALARWRAAR